MDQVEIWKDIEGFRGIYQVSNHGGLKSFKAKSYGRILKNTNAKGGYYSVVLRSHNGKVRFTRIHRLVAEAFIPNPNNLREVNHKDGNKQNNTVENLEWVTPSENIQDAMKRSPQMVSGMNHYNQFVRPKTIVQFSLDSKYIAEYPNAAEAAKSTGVCQRNILQVASKEEYKPGRTRKQAGGFIWKYKEIEKVAI